MRRFRWVRGVVVFGLAGALVGVVPDGVSAVEARKECHATAFVTNSGSDTVSTIDVDEDQASDRRLGRLVPVGGGGDA
jgi:hypothetical protein